MQLEEGVRGFSSDGIPMALGVCLSWSVLGTTFVYFVFERVIRLNGPRRNGLHIAGLLVVAAALFLVSLRFARGWLAADRGAREAAYSAESDLLPPLSETGLWLGVDEAGEYLLFTAGPASRGGELHACIARARKEFRPVAEEGFEDFALLDCVTVVMFEMPEALERIHEGGRRVARNADGWGYRQGEYLVPWLHFERPELVLCELPADTSVSYLHAAVRAARNHVPSASRIGISVLPRARTTSLSAFFAGRESFGDDLGYMPLDLQWEPGTPRLRLQGSGWRVGGDSRSASGPALAALGELDGRGVRLQIDAELDMQQLVDALDELCERGVERIAID